MAILADVLSPYDPSALGVAYQKPSPEHLLGTNDLGQDIFSEMLYGARVSLFLGVFSALIVTLVGSVLALIAGYYGGVADRIIVMCDGRITGELKGGEATQEEILRLATSFENKIQAGVEEV